MFTKDGQTVHENGNPIPKPIGRNSKCCMALMHATIDASSISTDQIADAELASFRPLDGLYATDSGHVYWMGKTIDGADPNTFRVLMPTSSPQPTASTPYRQTVIADANPRAFPPDRAVTNFCETSISFAE